MGKRETALVIVLINCIVNAYVLFGQSVKQITLKPVYQFSGIGAERNSQLYSPSDFIVTDNNEIVVCDKDDNSIVIFNEYGDFIRRFCSTGQGPSELNHPMRIGILDNNLAVLDCNNNRVQILSIDGKYIQSYQAPPITSLYLSGSRIVFTDDGEYYFNPGSYDSESLIIQKYLDKGLIKGYGKIYGSKKNYLDSGKKLVKKGKIPDVYKNRVFPVATSEKYVYCIHCSIPVIRMFAPDGKELWVKHLNLPECKLIKKLWIKDNKEAPANVTYRLNYWKDAVVTDDDKLLMLCNIDDRMVMYEAGMDGTIRKCYLGVNDNIAMIYVKGENLWVFGSDTHKFYRFKLEK